MFIIMRNSKLMHMSLHYDATCDRQTDLSAVREIKLFINISAAPELS